MRLAVASAVALLLSLLGPSGANAQVNLVPIQGYLTSSSGSVVDGAVTIDFRIYGHATSLSPLLFEETGVVLTVNEGHFVHYLGTAAAMDLGVFDGTRAYLELQVDGEVPMTPRTEFGVTAYAAYAANSGGVDWADVRGVPAELADGDDDTSVSSVLPLRGPIGGVLSLDSSGCAAGATWIWSGVAWECTHPAGTAYGTATGGGLTLDGSNDFAVDGTVQRTLSGACAPGEYLRAISADGTVTCQADSAGGTYDAATGGGLTMDGSNEFGIDDLVTQRRIGGTCDPGYAMRAINRDGTVVCEADDGQNLSGGSGIDINGTTHVVSVDNTVQRVLGNTCTYGIQAIDPDGTVTCAARDNTTYSAGAGLSLSGTTLAVDGTIQQRIDGTACAGNTFAQSIDAAGNIICGTPADNNTTYSSGDGITLSGTTFSAAANVQRVLTSACAAGQYIQAIAANGTVTCGNVADHASGGTITGVTAGTGLTGGGTGGTVTLSADLGVVQRRVSGACGAGQAIRSIDGTGAVVCGYADDPLREMTQRQFSNLIATGAPITWSTNHRLQWPAGHHIRAIGDVHYDLNSHSQLILEMPPVGTQIRNFAGAVASTVDGAGIPIGNWQGLWYRLDDGTTSPYSVAANYRVDSYNSGVGTAGMRDGNWMLIAFRPNQNGDAVYVNVDGGFRLRPGHAYDSAHSSMMIENRDGVISQRAYTAEPYHFVNTVAYRGYTRPIPHDVLLEYCGDREGCRIVITMHDWSNDTTWGASREMRFYYDPVAQSGRHKWRRDYYGSDLEAWDNDGANTHIINVWACYLTDHEYRPWTVLRNDTSVGLHWMGWSQYSNNSCELTFYD
ncbi:MAG: hypothetical protein ACJAYU_000457 [Bradymonadia bacterium]|jgi:hypothetical protein